MDQTQQQQQQQQQQTPAASEASAAASSTSTLDLSSYTPITSAGYDHDPMLFGIVGGSGGAGSAAAAAAAAYGVLDSSTRTNTAMPSDLPSFAGLGEIEDLIDLDFIYNNLVGVGRFDSLPNAGSSEEQVELEMGPALVGMGSGGAFNNSFSTAGTFGGGGESASAPPETGAGKVKKKTQELRRKVDAARKQFEGCPVGIGGDDDLPTTTALPLPPAPTLSLPPASRPQMPTQPTTLAHPPSARAFNQVRKESKRRKVCQACILCRKAHMSCDEVRPCGRCVRRGVAHLCLDAPKKVEPPPKPVVTYPVNIAPAPVLPVSIAPAPPAPISIAHNTPSSAPIAPPLPPPPPPPTLLPASLQPLATFTGAPPIPPLAATLPAMSLEQQVALINLLTANASLLAGASAVAPAIAGGNSTVQHQQQQQQQQHQHQHQHQQPILPAPPPHLAVYPDASFVNMVNMSSASPLTGMREAANTLVTLQQQQSAQNQHHPQPLAMQQEQPHPLQLHQQQQQLLHNQHQPQQQQQVNPPEYSQFTFNPYLSHLSLLSGLTATTQPQVELEHHSEVLQPPEQQQQPPEPSPAPPNGALAAGSLNNLATIVTQQPGATIQSRVRSLSNASLIREYLSHAQHQQQQQQQQQLQAAPAPAPPPSSNREPTPSTPYLTSYSPVVSSARSTTPGTPRSAYTPVIPAVSRMPSPGPGTARYQQLAQQQQQPVQQYHLQLQQQQQQQQQQLSLTEQQHYHSFQRHQRSSSLQSPHGYGQSQAASRPQQSTLSQDLLVPNTSEQQRHQRKLRQPQQLQQQQQQQQKQAHSPAAAAAVQPQPQQQHPQQHPNSSVSAEVAALAELLATTAGDDSLNVGEATDGASATDAADGNAGNHACTAGSDGNQPCKGCPFTTLERFYLVAAGDQPPPGHPHITTTSSSLSLSSSSVNKIATGRSQNVTPSTTAITTKPLPPTTADRLDGILAAKRSAGLLRQHDYTTGYLRLGHHLATHSSPATRQRIVRVVGAMHEGFTALATKANNNKRSKPPHRDDGSDTSTDDDDDDDDEDSDNNEPAVSEETQFERLLLDYDTIFAMSGVPAAAWRRTGEIVRANREFARLVRLDPRLLRDGLVCIYELMDESSGADYWEEFGRVGFCGERRRRRRPEACKQRRRRGRNSRIRPSRFHDGEGKMEKGGEGPRDAAKQDIGEHDDDDDDAADKEQDEEEEEVLKGWMATTPCTLRVARGTPKERQVRCAYAVTVRRDTRGVPLLCAGNFIRIDDPHSHKQREASSAAPVVLPDWVQEGVDAAQRPPSQVRPPPERRGSSLVDVVPAAGTSSSSLSSAAWSYSLPPPPPETPGEDIKQGVTTASSYPAPQQQQRQPHNNQNDPASRSSSSSSSSNTFSNTGAADVASLIAMIGGDDPHAERELLRRALEDLVGVRG
ncbi:hypothetical protein HDU86_000961 [Geranomyces michiganensis]|nr:hypothetical protein HDU86_000961 [Geranomyces michiganensis]